MKTILMLIVGLMLAGCGSVRSARQATNEREHTGDRNAVDHNAVDTICACP
jgi:uncharacterized protein YceK